MYMHAPSCTSSRSMISINGFNFHFATDAGLDRTNWKPLRYVLVTIMQAEPVPGDRRSL